MDKVTKWLITVLAVFAVGITAGGFFAIKTEPTMLEDYFAGLSGGEISIRTVGAVLSAAAMWLILFFSAFFKFGAITTALAVSARGFVDGYSITAILRILGFRGLALCFFDIFGVPIIVLMATNVLCVLTSDEPNGIGYFIRSIILLLALLAMAAISSMLAGRIISDFEF